MEVTTRGSKPPRPLHPRSLSLAAASQIRAPLIPAPGRAVEAVDTDRAAEVEVAADIDLEEEAEAEADTGREEAPVERGPAPAEAAHRVEVASATSRAVKSALSAWTR